MDSLMKGQDYSELKDSYILFICKRAPFKDDFTNRLSALVEQIKDNEKFRRDYAAMNLHDRDITRAAKQEGLRQGLSQGLAQGASKAKIEAAQNLWTNGVSQEIIAQSLGLPLAKVAEIINGKQSGVSVP